MQRLQTFYRRLGQDSSLRGRLVAIVAAVLLTIGLVVPSLVAAWRESNPFTLNQANQGDVGFPAVAIDNEGYVHAVWLSLASSIKEGQVFYTRGQLSRAPDNSLIVENWQPAERVLLDDAHVNNRPEIVASDNGEVFIAYGSTAGTYIVARNSQRGAPGQWFREVISPMIGGGNAANFGVNIALDDAGAPYVSWAGGFGSGDNTRIFFSYRQDNGAWSGVRQVSGNFTLVRNTSIAVSGSGPGANVHIVYEIDNSGGFGTRHTYGTRDGGFTDRDLTAELGHGKQGDLPDVTVDNNGDVYVSYVRPVSGGGFTLNVARSTNGGVDWSRDTQVDLRIGRDVWPGEHNIIANDGNVLMVSDQKFNFGRNTRVFYQAYNFLTGDNTGYTRISADEGSGASSFDQSSAGAVALFNANGLNDVKYNLDDTGGTIPPTPTPTPEPRPSGRLVIDNDAQDSIDTTVSVAFVDLQGSDSGYEYKLSNTPNGLDSDDGFQDLPADGIISDWQIESAASGSEACVDRNVYGMLRSKSNGLKSDTLSDLIKYDPGVDLDYLVTQNPFFSDNEELDGDALALTLQDFGGAYAASDGDSRYTRIPFFFAAVDSGQGECGGIDRVQFKTQGAPDDPSQYTSLNSVEDDDNYAEGLVSLPQFIDGEYRMDVRVEDGNGQVTFLQRSVIVDTQAPQIMNTNEVSPELKIDFSVISGTNEVISQTDSILVDLQLTNVQVAENLYGNHGEDATFWGLWMLNTTETVSPTNQNNLAQLDSLDWQPLEIDNAIPSLQGDGYDVFIQDWSLAAGIDPSLIGSQDVTVSVCMRVLDGAGNASRETVCTQAVVVTTEAELLQVVAPMINRN